MDVTRFRNKKVAVLGLGKAGKSAAAALSIGGAEVFAWDDNPDSRAALGTGSVEDTFLAESITLQPPEKYPWSSISALVMSPGIPLTHPKPHPAVELAKKANCPIICDIELLFYSCRGPHYIGITGTNGKSTTTSLIGHILQHAGMPCQVGGNIGIPALDLEPLWQGGAYVLEVSSYQLDLLHKAKFDISVLLNITPDHIDRHGSMEGYIASKKKIFSRQNAGDVAILGVDDPIVRKIHEELVQAGNIGKVIPVSVKERIDGGVSIIDGVLYNDIGTKDMFGVELGNLERLPGKHNAQNIAASFATAYVLQITSDKIIDGIRTFQGLQHRLQLVGALQGVKFVNDSKATNADAASHALGAYEKNIYWIAGGLPKEGGIESLASYFPRIRHTFLIGQAQDAFAATLEGKVAYTKCGDLEKAFNEAAAMAIENARKEGKEAVVLLSPACASWDQWKNFEVRGEAFCSQAEQYIAEHNKPLLQEA